MLREAVRRHKPQCQHAKPVVQTQNGPQFISQQFEDRNAFIEAVNGTMEEERLASNQFQTFAEAYLTEIDFIDFYNRRHSALGYRSPQELGEAYRQHHTRLAPVKL